MNATLTLLCGLPGAGKSTWAAQHAEPECIATADSIRDGADARGVFAHVWRRAAARLVEGRSVIVDLCALRPIDRMPALQLARNHGVAAELVVFCVPVALCMARNRKRSNPAAVDWKVYATMGRFMLTAVQREQWTRVRYVPKRDPSAFELDGVKL